MTETDADRDFIDRDDDLADIAKEYHEEKQKFDDEAESAGAEPVEQPSGGRS